MCAFAATKVARTGPERRQRAIVLSLDEMVDPMIITLISHIKSECPKMIRYMNIILIITGWWFGTCVICPYVGNNHPN